MKRLQVYEVYSTNQDYTYFNGYRFVASSKKEAYEVLCGLDSLVEPMKYVADNYEVKLIKDFGEVEDETYQDVLDNDSLEQAILNYCSK